MIIKVLEILRIIGTGLGIFMAYYYGKNPQEILSIMTPWLLVSIAGLSAMEGLIWGKKAAQATGYETGSNYQKQSAFAFLSMAIMSLVVYFFSWGAMANIALVLTFVLFLFMSAINHGYHAIVNKNLTWKNAIRPLLTALLIAVFWYPVTSILFN
jgi:VIT1/CCC1 family predicted Fe2+/Mn2+ transporter